MNAESRVTFPVRALLLGWSAARHGAVVHLGDCALAPLGMFLRMLCPHARLTITVCGLDVVYPARWYQWMIKRSLPCFDRIVCISDATANAVSERGVDPGKIVVIPCGVWPSSPNPNPEPVASRRSGASPNPRLLTVGRLVKRKGIAWFVQEVLPLLLRDFPTLQYTIVGDGPERNAIEAAVHALKLRDYVTLLGAVEDAVKEKELSEADLFVMPNVNVEGDMEGFGLVCIEASSLGLPVAASRLEGLRSAVREGETGMFFEAQDPQDAVRVISQLLLEPMDRSNVKASTFELFNWETLANRYRDEVFSRAMNFEPTRIGLVSWDYDPPKGGLGRATQFIVESLRDNGEDVQILTWNARNTTKRSIHQYINILMFRWFRRLPLSRLVLSAVLAITLRRWVRKERIRRLLLPTGPGGFFLFRKPKGCRTFILSYHTYFQQACLVPGEWWKRVFVPFERRTLRFADRILCYSEDTRRVLIEHYGIDPERIGLLPQIFDVDRWTKRMKKTESATFNLCVCVARLDRRKGILELLSAWVHVQRELSVAKLVIVGRGTLAKTVDAFIDEHQLCVQRIPTLPKGELVDLVRGADLVLCPSYLEGFGLTAAEAMAAGTVVVASETDGLRSLIEHNVSGVLVLPGDARAWAGAIIRLLRCPRERARLSSRARASIRWRFDRARATRALQESLKAL